MLIWHGRRRVTCGQGEGVLISGTEFKIIDTISREIGNRISINGLTTEIKQEFGSAHYSNIYNALLELKDKNIIQIEKQGNASIPLLNFSNYLLPDMLFELELQKKRDFLEKWPEAQFLLSNLDQELSGLSFIRSILLIDPEHNMKLNRAELLILIDQENLANRQKTRSIINELRRHHNIRMEDLILSQSKLIDFLKSSEKNPIKEMISNKIATYLPQSFWNLIRNAYMHGDRIRFDNERTNLSKIKESDMAYNLARFGYMELGPEIIQGEDYSIEYILSSILFGDDPRRAAAASILISKNRPNFELLEFLSMRHGFAEKLLGLLEAINDISPAPEFSDAIWAFKDRGINPSRKDDGQIRNLMEVYDLRAR